MSAGPPTRLLVVAKAPHAGRVKTRLGATIGDAAAAEIAAAALLDTLAACRAAVGPARCVLALAGDLDGSVREAEVRAALAGWAVVPQRGEGFAGRLAAAHADAGPGPVVQVGMDTPQVTAALLDEVVTGLERDDAVLGAAPDGGWWVLGLRDPDDAAALCDVAMSTSTTGSRTRAALAARGLSVGEAPLLTDVDDEADADQVSEQAPGTAFARAWHGVRAR